MIELTDTNASAIAEALLRARTHAGSPAMGMVMTLVVVVPEEQATDAMEVARAASYEHPARVLGVVLGGRGGRSAVHAQVGAGSGWTGETAIVRLRGEVVEHPESVVLPLLLPDSPVVVWWPAEAPADPAADPIGALARRRITDAAADPHRPQRALRAQCAAYARGHTDLAWTRLTPWRALLAAALDQHHVEVTGGSVTAAAGSPSADLLAAWLVDRLEVEVARSVSDGPGLTAVVLDTDEGPISITREDGRSAVFRTPGRPARPVALKRREPAELLAEELRRLDEDEVYAATTRRLAQMGDTAP